MVSGQTVSAERLSWSCSERIEVAFGGDDRHETDADRRCQAGGTKVEVGRDIEVMKGSRPVSQAVICVSPSVNLMLEPFEAGLRRVAPRNRLH